MYIYRCIFIYILNIDRYICAPHQLVYGLLVLGWKLSLCSCRIGHKRVESAPRLRGDRGVRRAEGGQHADELAAQLLGEVAIRRAGRPADLGDLGTMNRLGLHLYYVCIVCISLYVYRQR